ncbi:MAG: HAMP domain-containing histidine kinase [Candidatus Margulisbacteria bacterium]|nr:HAMP domain-containing histidine kinase [Candidatus Margulisiibacteriota bacterium]
MRLTTTETIREEKPYVDLVIEDSGLGIPTEKPPRILEAFYTTKRGNISLGLSLCTKIFAENDCIVNVQSESGKGTAFTLSFPVLTQ